MHRSPSFRGALVAFAIFTSAVGLADTSKLCTSASPWVVLDGPGADSHHLVNSSVDYYAAVCATGLSGCKPTVASIKVGTFHGGAWVNGPTTLASGAPTAPGAPAIVAASQSLKKRGEVHVGALSGFGCQGLRFFAQTAPSVTTATVLPGGGTFGGLRYFNVGETVMLQATGQVDVDYSIDRAASFEWTLDNGQTATSDAAVASYARAGEYFPTVKVSDGKFASQPRQVALWIRGPAQPPDRIGSFRDCDTGRYQMDWERTGTAFELEVLVDGVWVARYSGSEPATELLATDQNRAVRVRAFDPTFGVEPSGWASGTVERQVCVIEDPNL